MKLQTEIKEERTLPVGPDIEIAYSIEATAERWFPGQSPRSNQPIAFDVVAFEFELLFEGEACKGACSEEFRALVEKLVLKSIQGRLDAGQMAYQAWNNPEEI